MRFLQKHSIDYQLHLGCLFLYFPSAINGQEIGVKIVSLNGEELFTGNYRGAGSCAIDVEYINKPFKVFVRYSNKLWTKKFTP